MRVEATSAFGCYLPHLLLQPQELVLEQRSHLQAAAQEVQARDLVEESCRQESCLRGRNLQVDPLVVPSEVGREEAAEETSEVVLEETADVGCIHDTSLEKQVDRQGVRSAVHCDLAVQTA